MNTIKSFEMKSFEQWIEEETFSIDTSKVYRQCFIQDYNFFFKKKE